MLFFTIIGQRQLRSSEKTCCRSKAWTCVNLLWQTFK